MEAGQGGDLPVAEPAADLDASLFARAAERERVLAEVRAELGRVERERDAYRATLELAAETLDRLGVPRTSGLRWRLGWFEGRFGAPR